MGLKSMAIKAGIKSAMGGGGLPFLLIGAGIAFAAGGTFGAWGANTIRDAGEAKELRIQELELKAAHAQEITDRDGKIAALAIEKDAMAKKVTEEAGKRQEQEKRFGQQAWRTNNRMKSLEEKIANAKGGFYDMQIPDDAVDILNCAFEFILCDEYGNPAIAGQAKDLQGDSNGQSEPGFNGYQTPE